ncbi:MAG: methyltransferase family protein [Planctomycetota bacterium]|nr:methyltransferase family protein [Planctomycetota bacterium]
MVDYTYVGRELDLFAEASVWKSHLRRQVGPFLGPEVLEVGAGHGGTTRVFCSPGFTRWVCLEPDASLAARLASAIDAGELPACCSQIVGTLDQMRERAAFDTLLYIDVLEHIEDDRAEILHAAEMLRPGGYLVVLAPAHQWLTSPFDHAVGHFRRYSKASLRAVGPPGLDLVRLAYLDAAGLLASLGNRLVLKRSSPNSRQIKFWDKWLVPVSRVVGPVIRYTVGKSVLGVWRKP